MGHIDRIENASVNWTAMCMVVTNIGKGKLKYFGENIHLLYMESRVANKNLVASEISVGALPTIP